VVAEGSHLRVVNDNAIPDVPVLGRCLVCKQMIALVRLLSLVAPEALDLSTVLLFGRFLGAVSTTRLTGQGARPWLLVMRDVRAASPDPTPALDTRQRAP
jgi:hypothetical protein